MRIGVLLVCWGLAGCGGHATGTDLPTGAAGAKGVGGAQSEDSAGAAQASAGSAARACGYAASLSDAGPGACTIGPVYLECNGESVSCGCFGHDLTTCPGCGPATGATCTSRCAANEYAVSCGGPPQPDQNFEYQSPPAGCRNVSANPGGSLAACCPCE